MPYFGNEPAKSAIKVGDNTVLSATIANGVIINEDIKSDAAIAMSKTALVAGTGITLATNTLNVDASQTQITSVGSLTGLTIDASDPTLTLKSDGDGNANTGYVAWQSDDGTSEGWLGYGSTSDSAFKLYLPSGNDHIEFLPNATSALTLTSSSATFTGDLLVSSTDPTITIKRSNSSSYAGHLDFTNNADALGWQVGTNQVAGDGFEVNYGASNKFYVTTGGNVGIGVSAPDSPLHVHKATAGSVDANANAVIVAENSGDCNIQLLSPVASDQYLLFSTPSGNRTYFKVDCNATGTSENLGIFTNATERITVLGSGNVGIGVTNPSSFDDEAERLVVGTGSGNQGITVYAGTSSRAKIHFADGASGTSAYRGMVSYNHNDDSMSLATSNTTALTLDSLQNATFAGAIIQDGGDTFAHFGRGDSDSRIILGSQGGTYSSGSTNAFNNFRAHSGGMILNVAGSSDTFVFEHNGTGNLTLSPTTATFGGNVEVSGAFEQSASAGTGMFVRKIRQESGTFNGDLVIYCTSTGWKSVMYDVTVSGYNGNGHWHGMFYWNAGEGDHSRSVANYNSGVADLALGTYSGGSGSQGFKLQANLTNVVHPLVKVELTTGGGDTIPASDISIDFT